MYVDMYVHMYIAHKEGKLYMKYFTSEMMWGGVANMDSVA